MLPDRKQVKIAVLDLYEGEPNQGMRCIRQIVHDYCREHDLQLKYDEFDVRLKGQLPGAGYDIYISTGGPGSPIDSEGAEWEMQYFNWIHEIEQYNDSPANKDQRKKHILFICHSFQLACRYFDVANVAKRKSTAFGVFPVHIIEKGKDEPIFNGLPDPFYAVENRDYQVIEPNYEKLEAIGACILAIEKERPHVPLERAVMALRFNDYMLGTQFHPEVEPGGMTSYLHRNDKKEMVIENHGLDKWKSMIHLLSDPATIGWTYSHVIPNFLDQAVEQNVSYSHC